jgi:hypothetical protein
MLSNNKLGPYIVIGDALESLVYSKLKLKVHIQDDYEDKFNLISQLISTEYSTVIHCSTSEVATKIRQKLRDFNTTLITDDLDVYSASEAIRNW